MSTTTPFEWPSGKRCAVSITFDDARPSQLDAGIPVLDRFGVKATFYVSIGPMAPRASDWRAVMANGHEIGNHSKTHPCSGNFSFSRNAALENHTLESIRQDIVDAGDEIAALIGCRQTTFAYPCGQTYVGRSVETRSYVPVVADLFLAGRGFREEYANDPAFTDLAQLAGTEFDGISVGALREQLTEAAAEGSWLILVGHDIGACAYQTVVTETLETLCRRAVHESSDVWCATVQQVAQYISDARKAVD